jgi:hypothetical protein
MPTCLIYGNVNEGKTSVISTWFRLDEVPIERKAGTTTKTRPYYLTLKGKRRLCACDSPGLQNQSEVIKWLKSPERNQLEDHSITQAFLDDPKFNKRNDKGKDLFREDREIIKGIQQTDFILLVLKADKKLTPGLRKIIETAHLWQRPVGIVLNKTETDKATTKKVIADLEKTGKHFCLFDAHTSGFQKRLELTEYLLFLAKFSGYKRGLYSKSLEKCISEMKRDWELSFEEIAKVVVSALKECMEIKIKCETEDRKEEGDEFDTKVKKIIEVTYEKIRGRLKHKILETFEATQIEKSEKFENSELEFDFSRWTFLGKFFRFRPAIGPIFDAEEGRRKNFVKQFIANCICFARECANHPHADRDKAKAKRSVKKEEALEVAGFKARRADNHPCYWTGVNYRKLSTFSETEGGNKDDLITTLKEKLLKSLEVTDEHLS